MNLICYYSHVKTIIQKIGRNTMKFDSIIAMTCGSGAAGHRTVAQGEFVLPARVLNASFKRYACRSLGAVSEPRLREV